MIRRWILLGASVAIAAFLIGSLALWLILSAWVPTKGKALLIHELEQSGRLRVSIRTIRYDLFRGFQLGEVLLVDRRSNQTWLSTPIMSVQVSWMALLQKRFVFHVRTPIEIPAQTMCAVTGRYHLKTHSLVLDAQTTEVPLRSMAPPLRSYVPSSLTEGTLRLTLHLTQAPHQPPTVTGRLIGTQLVMVTPTLRTSGDLTFNGRVVLRPAEEGPPVIDALVSLRHGTVSGFSLVHEITNMQGTAQLTNEQLEIKELIGTALGSSWKLEGSVTRFGSPSVEFLLSTQARLAPLSETLPLFKETWHLSGTSSLQVMCRGPMQPRPFLDCLAHADVHEATLTGSTLASPVTHVTGRLEYDHLARQLSIEQLEGHVSHETLSTHGEIVLGDPPTLSLHVTGTLPLELLTGWIPSQASLKQIGGLAVLDLNLRGPLRVLQYTGRIEFRDAHTEVATFPQIIEGLTGVVTLSDKALSIQQVNVRVNHQPLTVTATIAPSPYGSEANLREPARIIATVDFPQGELQLTSRLTPEDFLIDQGTIALNQSHVRLNGTVGRRAQRVSAVSLSGTVELADLSDLPFVPLPIVKTWKLQGSATIDAQFEGQWTNWPSAILRGHLQADHVRVRDIPVEQLTCTIEQSNRTLRVRVPSALIADGKFIGELTVEHRTPSAEYLAQADLVGLQLANLSQIIPTWRTRSVTGTASAHALLSGPWDDRVAWRGEGWLNASGEQLGDVPLLDKVFRGLFGILGDRLGLEGLRRAKITQASVQWQLSKGRFRTEDLRFGGVAGTEPVAVYAKGSIGLDQTLDFVIEPELSEGVVLQAPNTSTLARTVLKAAGQLERFRQLIGRHRLTGTLKQPEYRFEFSTQEILKQLSPSAIDLLQDLLNTVR